VSLMAKLIELSELDDLVREADRRVVRPVAGEAVTAPVMGGDA
jgi:hypothetical protein